MASPHDHLDALRELVKDDDDLLVALGKMHNHIYGDGPCMRCDEAESST